MDKRLFEIILVSIKRRWKDVARTCVAAFLAVFFVTGILIFEENMFEWQVASNKDRFGNWFIMEANTREQSEYLKNHPKLDGCAEALSAVVLYDDKGRSTESMVGYMSKEFLKMGCINTTEGRFPKADNEIAMDWNSLSNIGITNPKVGQKVTIRYYEGSLSGDEKDCIEEEMVLVGILEDYSNVWCRSRYIPGALVTKAKYESFNNNCMTAYIYELDNEYRNSDYRTIYDEILSGTELKPAYNMYVYDFRPWNSENVYSYMYVIVMVIGIAALTYQLLVYNSSRSKAYELMGKLGASKSQIGLMAFIENAIMLIPSGLVGLIGATLVGWLVCSVIGFNMGVSFYYVDMEVLAKGLLSILISVFVELIISRVITIKKAFVQTRNAKRIVALEQREYKAHLQNQKKVKSNLNGKNVIRTLSFRFTRANKLAQNVGVRIFSLGISVVIVMCAVRIYDTYVLYNKNKDNIDLTGTFEVENDFTLNIPYYISYKADGSDGYDNRAHDSGKLDPSDYQVTPTVEEINALCNQFNRVLDVPDYGKYYVGSSTTPTILGGNDKIMSRHYFSLFRGPFFKEPKTNITRGISDYVKKSIESINGVESVTYGVYESQRAWSWDGMSLEKMGYGRLAYEKGFVTDDGGVSNTQMSVQPYASRDIFGTEYITPTKELYERLCKYIDSDRQNYDAFARGEQVVVFVQDNPYGVYDDTLTAGKNINYSYYEMLPERYNSYIVSDIQYVFESDEDCLRYMVVHGIPYSKIDYERYLDWYEEQIRLFRRASMEPCVQTEAAAVIRITDDIKEELADVLTNNAYYMAVASTELAEAACKKQDEITAEFFELNVDELPEECRTKMVYNQIVVKYNLLSTISATDNILSTYCEENGIEYKSYAAVNEQYRTDFINAVLQYGTTIIALIVINMLICVIVAKNRIETRRYKTELLLRLGAEKRDVRKVFMIEAVREALWCVFTLPIVLAIQYRIYSV